MIMRKKKCFIFGSGEKEFDLNRLFFFLLNYFWWFISWRCYNVVSDVNSDVCLFFFIIYLEMWKCFWQIGHNMLSWQMYINQFVI